MNTLTIVVALLGGPSCQGTEAEFAAGIICPADQCEHACHLLDSGRILRRVYTGGPNSIEGRWIDVPTS